MEQRVTKSETWQKQLVKHVIPGGGLWPGWNPSFNSVELRMSHSISSSLSFPIWYMRGKIVHITSGFHGGSGGKVGKIPWRRKWQPTPVLLPKKFDGWRSLVGYSPWDCKESHTAEQLHFIRDDVSALHCVRTLDEILQRRKNSLARQ